MPSLIQNLIERAKQLNEQFKADASRLERENAEAQAKALGAQTKLNAAKVAPERHALAPEPS